MILKKGFTLIAIAGFTYACSAPQAPVKQAVVAPSASVAVSQEPIVMQVGNKAITNTEFLQIYKKNLMAGDSSSAERSVKEYAELYSNFKLKVLAAEKQGRDTTTAFREELAMYRQQLAQSYLSEKNVTENLIKEVYDRLKEEVNASHILLSCLPDVSPDDTLKVYNKLIEIRDKALAGEDFGQLAKSYSQDPSAAQNAGNLGFFTALQMVYPFENTAYLTPKGKISMPVRTRFGYHLIKVNDRRTSRGKIKVAHIMTRVKANATTDDQLEAKKKIEEIFKLLEKGEKFEEVCKKYSEDPTSKQSKGELPMFGTGMMAQTFEEAAFSLTDIGEISRPVQTQYGWHILKLIEKKGLEPYPDMQGFLRQKVEADARSNVSKSSLVQRLKKDNNFIENTETVKEASMSIDSRLLKGIWNFDPDNGSILSKTMFTQGQNEITSVKDFFEYVKKKQVANEKSSVNVQVSKLYNDFVETKVLAYEDNQLEKKYPDFKYLMQEYRDGILLFQIMEDEVWQKSIKDTLGLRTFYANNKDKFQMPERINGLLLSTTSKEKLTEAQKLLGQMPYTMGKRLNDILYDKNQSSITSEIKERLFDVIVIMKKNPEYLVEIAGNIDPTEADSISGARAKKVVKYLTDNGILLARITEKDNGKFEPVSRTDRKLNQRLSFNFFSTSKKDIEKLLNKDNPEAVSLIDGYFKKGDSKIVDGADWKVGNQAFEKNGRFYYLDIRRVEAPRPKRFDEARGVVINAYQQYLEKQLLENLRKEYQININEEELKKLK